MVLIQKTINGTNYFTDDINYYTYHVVTSRDDFLWKFACMDLGISIAKAGKFSTDESTRINDLAGTGPGKQTKYLLLKNGQAVPVPYHNTGTNASAILNVNDVILRRVASPTPSAAAFTIKCPHCASDSKPGLYCSVCGKALPVKK